MSYLNIKHFFRILEKRKYMHDAGRIIQAGKQKCAQYKHTITNRCHKRLLLTFVETV